MMLYDPRTEDWIDDSELFMNFDPEVEMYDEDYAPGLISDDYIADEEEWPWSREDRI